MKYSAKYNETWDFYLNNLEALEFCGSRIPMPEQGDMTAKESFFIFDSTGVLNPCDNPELLHSVLFFKKALNLQIKEWAEGWNDMCEELDYYLSVFKNPPDWVGKAITKSVEKSAVGSTDFFASP